MSESFSRRKALTWIICTLVVVLGLPAGAFAVVAGSNVFISDASSGARAHVNTAGQLLVNAGNGVLGTPFQAACGPNTWNPATTYGSCTIALPAGKRLHIETVSALIEVAVPTSSAASVTAHGEFWFGDPATGRGMGLFLPAPWSGFSSGDFESYVGTQEVSAYANSVVSGPTITHALKFSCGVSTAADRCTGTVTGYLY